MKRNIVVTAAAEPLPEEQPVEIVERKGIGHPDTLCDGIAGKLYNVLALEAARAVVECVPTVRQAQVFVLSQIGQPLERPFVMAATVQSDEIELSLRTKGEVRDVLDGCLNQIERLREKIINGEIPLY